MGREKLIELGVCRDEEVLNKIYNAKKPLITFVMLSYIRYDSLKIVLNDILKKLQMPANIALRVQGARRLDTSGRKEIEDLCRKFNDYDLVFTEKNHGTGVPRWETIHRALKFNTPYLMFADDDMLYKEDSFEALACFLEQNPQVGAAAVFCESKKKGSYKGHHLVGNKFVAKEITLNQVNYVDAMGSATTMMRREVFDKCDYDKGYYIGCADFDLGLQMRNVGWKSVVLGHEALCAKNKAFIKNPKEYANVRYNLAHINRSVARFRSKWGVTP